MNYYGVIYFRRDENGIEKPNGKAYCFKSEEEFKIGDIVELPFHKKGFVGGAPVGEIPEEDKIKSIIGKWIADYE